VPVEGPEIAAGAGARVGISFDFDQLTRLSRYADWLRDEAVEAGLLGPAEGERIWSRHIADSLGFAAAWPEAPPRLLDVGSGAGLPGIPLAVAWPDCAVTLADRSQRACDLLARVKRLVPVPNMTVRCQDADEVEAGWPALVMRAAFPLPRAARVAGRLLTSGGRAAVGLGGRAGRTGVGTLGVVNQDSIEIQVLDGVSRLLIMTIRG